MYDKTDKKNYIALLIIAAWIFYNIAILLKTGFISDDAYNSQIRGSLIQDGITLHKRIVNEILGWINGSGRILISGWYMTYGLYYVTQNTIIVKSITIAVVITGVLFFYIFSKRQTDSQLIPLFACLLLPVFFQFRLWHDPILAFTFLIPIIFTFSMGSLILFQKYIDHGERLNYAGAIFIYLIPLLMYEVSYALCFLFIIVAFSQKKNFIKSLHLSLPFTGLVGLILVIIIIIRTNLVINNISGSTYPGAELHLDVGKLISAFIIQVSSAFPLSYYFFAKPGVSAKLYAYDYVFLIIFMVGLASIIYRIGKSTQYFNLKTWMASGIVLLFFPALLSSISGHQEELITAGYGFGYITVYIQYFGACILFVSLITFIVKKARGRWLIVLTIFLSILLTLVAGKNIKLNRGVAKKTNEVYLYPRELLQTALEAGIANEVKEGAFLFSKVRYPSDWMWFYTTVTGKKIITCDLNNITAYAECIARQGSKPEILDSISNISKMGVEVIDLSQKEAWTLSYNFDTDYGKSGRVILGKIDSVVQNKYTKNIIQLVVKKINVYDLKSNSIHKYDISEKPINFLKIISEQNADISQVKQLDFELLKVDTVDFEWLGKIYPFEGTKENNLRWTSGEADLFLHNLNDGTKKIQITMEFGAETSQSSKIMVEIDGKKEYMSMRQLPIKYTKLIKLDYGTKVIKFTSDAQPIGNGDPRNIVFGIYNFKIIEVNK